MRKTWTVTMQVVAPGGITADKIEAMIETAVDDDQEIEARHLDITQVRASED